MFLLILYFPLLGCLIAGFFSRFIGSRGSAVVTIFCMVLTVLLSFYIFYKVGLEGIFYNIKLMDWISCELLIVSWGFLFDSLTAVMLIVVTFISLLVHIFSYGYMGEDPHLSRFMSYLSLFTFFMLILVTADNFAQMFVGWEGVGLASYLLINFWYTRIQANKSAIKAIIINRIGDFGLVLGIASIFYFFGSLDFGVIFSIVSYFKDYNMVILGFEVNIISLISLLLFIGAVGKSAQLGLHVWLPDAMEGPTPVSALIHAATMVTAGVFVLIRCSPIIEYSNVALVVITIIGALTAFFAATSGLLQNDLKRVIAYSTCSQLGYMVFSCGLSSYGVSLFHLMNHAFFKALLFLGAGSIIHALSDEQDMRKMGGLLKILPFTYVMMFIGSLSLMGFPFLTGFYSKDVILELAFSNYSVHGSFAYWLGTISAFFTAFYSFRLIFLTFLAKPNGYKNIYLGVHEGSIYLGLPLFILSIGSIFIGFLLKDIIIGLGTPFWGNSLFYLYDHVYILNAEFLDVYIKNIPVIFSLFGAFSSLLLFNFLKKNYFFFQKSFFFRQFYLFLNRKWFFDIIYYNFLSKPFLFFGYNISFKMLDRGFIELLGPLGFVRLFNFLSKIISNIQSGYIYNYVLIMVIGIIFILLFLKLNFLFLIALDYNLLIVFILMLFFFF